LELKSVEETEAATLVWLVNAFPKAYANGQTKTVGYLESVAEEVLFELDVVTQRSKHLG
jgi:hypothetical protein